MPSPRFRGGPNIAMKLPAARFDDTVAFYRDVLGLHVTEEPSAATGMVSRSVRVDSTPTPCGSTGWTTTRTPTSGWS
ncbi:hypothetical protein G443_002431 [Actinoalloteichus cyanogriseus DSM 43889]|uniref:Glyoxalase/fosfomycin resistance/dioxygenase domain-containing protein n=1 Tax=Actinoalloteichus caeruleus DSM 43889 TaxID=1120930 RepID=A0ABT1JJ24_ACTCY|nr:hypothetical protein [Actinoalloteichus caeruleus DSM 43889]